MGKKKDNHVILGEMYRDPTTGFEGTAFSRTEYLYGCVRIHLEGKIGDDGKLPEFIFDEQRLERMDGTKPELTATAGGPQGSTPTQSASAISLQAI